MMQRFIKMGVLVMFVSTSSLVFGGSKNGFDISDALIPEDEILQGGPAKDDIPAIDNPKFSSGKKATLSPKSRVLGLFYKGVAKAYPISILNWHEVVNDTISGDKLVITYCPLCGSGMVFQSNVSGEPLTFGVSGLLYNNDVLLYDRQSQSLWSQIESKAVSGKKKGIKLKTVPVQNTSWVHWKKQHPNTLVLSKETGVARNYARDPYAGYVDTKTILFPVKFRALGIHPKEKVIGVKIDNKAKAWPFVELQKSSGVVVDDLAGQELTVKYDKTSQSAQVFSKSGKLMESTTLYWFAWAAFHPKTQVYKSGHI